MCFAARFLGEKSTVFYSEHTHGHKRTIKAAHKLLNEADAVLSFNGESFDLPTLNREFLKYELAPPAPYKHIDLLKVAKRRFRFVSNKMDHLAEELGIEGKVETGGFELWVRCMRGEAKAWKEMETYNRQDVQVLIDLYYKMIPWIDTHPNFGLYIEDPHDPTCTNCGSDDLQSRGLQRNKTHSYQRYQCNDCGTWLRGRFTKSKKNGNILTQIGG